MIATRACNRLLPTAFRFITSAPKSRLLSCSAILRAKDPKMSSGPPKHEMAYFPNMTAALPSKSGEFRRVLWTGLYSQVVLMTVPVGGDIGDEVGRLDFRLRGTCCIWSCMPFWKIPDLSLDLLGSHCWSSSHLYFWHWQSNYCWEGSRCQSRGLDGGTCWNSAPVRQYRPDSFG